MTEVELTPEELFEKCNFEDKDQIVALFPSYVREQYAVQGKKNVSKAVNIEVYTMKTPYGDKTLLKDTPLVLEAGRKQCLYGNNGAGKTLLFEYMSQHKIKDLPKHIHIHHCKELENHELSDTVLGTVVNSHAFRNILLKVQTKLQALIAAGEGDVEKLKEHLGWIQFSLTNVSAHDAEDRAAKMLRVLGFDEHGQKKLVSELSGGLRMRVALCIAFFVDCDLLLLDEPTNHLDFPSVLWLENRLRGFRGSFLLVTHDRELLNNVCHSVIYIDMEQKQLIYYPCGFKEFEKRKATDEKKKFDEIEKFLKRNQKTDPSTMLGRQVADKRAWSQSYFERQVAMQGKFTFPTSVKLDNIEDVPNPDDISLINLTNVRFSYNPALENPVFIFNTPISFNVKATTRVGVMGPNGAGKSTLLKLLTQKLIPTEGKVKQHPHFTLAYFGQHSTAELIMEETPIEFMTAQFPRANGGQLRGHLAKTGISGPVAETRMANLSYSQRSCVIFAKLTFVCPHLLIMDEPTNFLDLESVDSLISACNKYKGALLLVSHNRDFLRKCAKQYLSVVPGHFELYDEMKTAERATYTFIAEMEEGGGTVAKAALANNPGGGTVHASQKVGETKEGEAGAAAPKAAAAAAAPAVTFTVGEKVTALWTDKKWYAGEIKAVLPGNKYTVLYTQYGNTANVPAAGIKKGSAAAAPAAKPAAAAAGAKGAPAKGAPAKGAPAKGGRK